MLKQTQETFLCKKQKAKKEKIPALFDYRVSFIQEEVRKYSFDFISI